MLTGQTKSPREARIYTSIDFFVKDRKLVDLGLGKNSRGVVGMGAVQRYLVAALKPGNIFSEKLADGHSEPDEMLLFVSENGQDWSRGKFTHGHGLKENAYTIVESTSHSIMVDVLTNTSASSDFEKIVAVEGISIANTILNVEEIEAHKEEVKVQTKITFDDGGHWSLIHAPEKNVRGKGFKCDVSDIQSCALHLHSVTQPHNFGRVFSTPSPGILMGVGTVGEQLLPYGDCDTFLSIDGGLDLKMIKEGATKYEIGDQGGLIVLINDESNTDEVDYIVDFGKTSHLTRAPGMTGGNGLPALDEPRSQTAHLLPLSPPNTSTSSYFQTADPFLNHCSRFEERKDDWLTGFCPIDEFNRTARTNSQANEGDNKFFEGTSNGLQEVGVDDGRFDGYFYEPSVLSDVPIGVIDQE
ncbi:hypothetical protein PPACK8108_LOCUS22000 [Phakopsora pachyrhizi]|uniref:VPS10 domain-containing protein n=1 Tax=Phakopsora pachyrhizi TaxID=170000 RepID=A0AAV0BKY9_PHAPC|nr:hypothetical protein PPACK8108_LOCUS22000 [Phakopsora pachyrhizi]